MKKVFLCKIVSCLIIYLLLCVNVLAENNYTTINMSEFANVDNFAEGLCAVQDKTTDRWGFVDINKNWVISPQYKSASYFKNGVCAVNTVDGETVLINHKGDIVFKAGYDNNITSETFFLEKHGKYNIIFENTGRVVLLDENYNCITPDGVNLSTQNGASSTLFYDNNSAKIYNYTGKDITDKLLNENITFNGYVYGGNSVNNKYIVGQADGKIKCFDIHGNKVAEFINGGKFSLDGSLIVCNNKVHNISDNKTVFENENVDVEKIETYYTKFFTVKKKNGTSALYLANGKKLVDFGKWDYIYPTSASNNVVVCVNNKYGIANYEGDLLLPIEYGLKSVFVSSKNPMYYSILSNDGKYVALAKGNEIVVVNTANLKTYNVANTNSIYTGYKYHKIKGVILDNNFNPVYSDESIDYVGRLEGINNGIVKQIYSGHPTTYGFVLFNDGGVKVELDSSRLEFDVLPIIQNGRTLVPMRAIFEALGANVEWNGETRTIIAKNKDVTIQMQIGNNTLIKNGKSTQMDVSPQLVDGRTMVPVRAVSDSFNVTVDWNGYTQTVSLFTN